MAIAEHKRKSRKSVSEKHEEKIKKLRAGETASLRAALVSFLLAILKASVALISGSLALLSDALHSVSDLVVMLASWLGLKIAQRKPDERFPYGYYKAESLATLFVSMIIIYGAVELGIEAVKSFFTATKMSLFFLALLTAFISAFASAFVALYLTRIGKSIGSQLLITASRERITDVISSLAVFIAILLANFGISYADGIVSLLISLLILRIGFESGKNAVFALMDISPVELEARVMRILRGAKHVTAVKSLKLRKSGPFVFGEVELAVRPGINVKQAHEISDEVEQRVKREVPEIESFTIHIEPQQPTRLRIAIPINEKSKQAMVAEHLGRSKYYMIVEAEKGKVTKLSIVKNPYFTKPVRAGLAAIHFLVNKKINTLITKEIGEIAFHTARDHMIDVYHVGSERALDAVEKLLRGELSRMKQATKSKI